MRDVSQLSSQLFGLDSDDNLKQFLDVSIRSWSNLFNASISNLNHQITVTSLSATPSSYVLPISVHAISYEKYENVFFPFGRYAYKYANFNFPPAHMLEILIQNNICDRAMNKRSYLRWEGESLWSHIFGNSVLARFSQDIIGGVRESVTSEYCKVRGFIEMIKVKSKLCMQVSHET